MKMTTHIHGMTLVYSDHAVDRTGVDKANAEDRAEADRNLATAQSILAEMEQVGRERINTWGQSIPPEAGLDSKGQWHSPNAPYTLQFADTRQHGTGVVRAIILSLLFWIAAICAIAHFAQKQGLPLEVKNENR